MILLLITLSTSLFYFLKFSSDSVQSVEKLSVFVIFIFYEISSKFVYIIREKDENIGTVYTV